MREIGWASHLTDEGTMNFFVGTSGYSYKEWKGSFYPEDLPASQMLRFYGERLRTVEINNTFYRMPKVSVVEAWAAEVPESFRFVLKASQRITHMKRLKDAAEPLAYFLEVAGVLKKRLGPLLFQLPPNFKKDSPRLEAFLSTLPADRKAAFEFRHASWFDPEVFGLLREHGAALCIAEAEEDLEVPFEATAGWGYLRLRRADYDDAELAAWAARVRQQSWTDAYVFFKHEDEGKAPVLARRFLELAAHPGDVGLAANHPPSSAERGAEAAKEDGPQPRASEGTDGSTGRPPEGG